MLPCELGHVPGLAVVSLTHDRKSSLRGSGVISAVGEPHSPSNVASMIGGQRYAPWSAAAAAEPVQTSMYRWGLELSYFLRTVG